MRHIRYLIPKCLHVSKRTFHSSMKNIQFSKKFIFGVGVVGLFSAIALRSHTPLSESQKEQKVNEQLNDLLKTETAGEIIEGLPYFTLEDVAKHKTKEDRIWVTYRNGVYDITDFIAIHPGGEKILLAVGSQIDPYWNIYQIHKNPTTFALLEKYRIGNLKVDPNERQVMDDNDPFLNEPERNSVLVVRNAKPYNAETPESLLVDSFITPNDLFFVRNHLPVPKIDAKEYRLVIQLDDMKEVILTLDDLKNNFEKHKIVSTIQCAGNRRSGMSTAKKVDGLPWNKGAISTAEWTGVKLKDVLAFAGFDGKNGEIKHVQFEGYDHDPSKTPYGASIPIQKAMDPNGDVLLAFEMNGQEIPPDHGYPIRLIVPGVVGARQVKWLAKIIVSKDESPSFWQQKDYKTFSPSTNWDNLDYKSAPAIQELPVQSSICYPPNGAIIKEEDGYITIKGYAYSGGGRGIARVEVSIDGGKNWIDAELRKDIEQEYNKNWAWTLWEADIPIPENQENLEIVCKAVDTSYNTQPENVESIWNMRGLINNSWDRVTVKIEKQVENDENEDDEESK